MKIQRIAILSLMAIALFTSCKKEEIVHESYYSCNETPANLKDAHPNANRYQTILDQNQRDGLVGAVLLVKDQNGLWIGSSGKADIPSNIDVQPCNTFLIASISKVFTASAIYSYVDKGILSLDDPISQWIDNSITDKVSNADAAQIKHLLSHRSGIVDFYTSKFELDRYNNVHNKWSKEDVIKFIYNKKADFKVDETYGYSNTNYLLLSMILENASNLSLEEVYRQEIFDPLDLQTAYYNETNPIPDGTVRGYDEFTYASGHFHDSWNLYIDEVGIGGDGGIAINAYDLSVFLESLMKGQLISHNSLSEMTNWFDLPEDEQWEAFGQTENGFGLEKFNTPFGSAVGHTGGMDGFDSYGFYFPQEDMTYILLVNGTNGDSDAHENIFNSVLEIMF